MSDATPDPDAERDPGREAPRPDRPQGLLAALNVARNGAIGVGVGVVVAAVVYAVRVFELLGPAPEGQGNPLFFAMLAFVLAFGVAALVTFGLVIVSAIRRARELSES